MLTHRISATGGGVRPPGAPPHFLRMTGDMLTSILSRLKPGFKTLLGVDVGSSAIKMAQLKRNGPSSLKLIHLAYEALPRDSIADGVIISKLAVSDAISRVLNTRGVRDRRIATSVCGHSVIVKKVSLPLQTEEELRESIQWEAEQYIPFDIAEVNLDYQILREEGRDGKIEVLLVAAKKDKILDQTTVFSMAGRKPAVVDIDAFALQNVFEFGYQPNGQDVVALLDIGSSTINVSVVRGGQFLFNRDIALGGSQYNEALQREFTVPYEEAERYKLGDLPTQELGRRVDQTLGTVSGLLTTEIQRTFDFFQASVECGRIHRIYLSGGARQTRGLKSCLQDRLRIPVEYLDPFRNIELESKEIPQEMVTDLAGHFTIAVGLALRSERRR